MAESAPKRGSHVKASPWVDLVYHALAHLPVAATDASSIFDERYVRWSAEQLAACARGVPRTLLVDAARMAALYDASEQAFLLHAWALLWDDLDGFLRDMGADFAKLAWPNPSRDRLARAIIAGTHPALPDLFRTALWSEARNGFETHWRNAVAPRARAYRERFAREIASLEGRLPGLREVAWVLSLPLRVHGRLLESATESPVIVVGVADGELGVEESHPVVQGCHEYLVWKVQRVVSAPQPWSTVSGRPGHEAFRSVEDAALTLGARVFRGSEWENAYESWLSRLFPNASPAETAACLAEGKCLSPELAAVLERAVGTFCLSRAGEEGSRRDATRRRISPADK